MKVEQSTLAKPGNYDFTRNWTREAVRNWKRHFSHLTGSALTILEIGVFEGRFACWLLDNILTHPQSRYMGIDDWSFSYHFYTNLNGSEFEARARRNLARHDSKADIMAGPSQTILRRPRWKDATVDVAYVDGDHRFEACLADSILVWPLIKPGGYLVWDDYVIHGAVKDGAGAFLRCIPDEYETVFEGRQKGIRKLGGRHTESRTYDGAMDREDRR